MKILKEEDVLFLMLMGVFLWDINPLSFYTLTQEEFNKVVLILLVLAGNIYVITRSHKSYSIIEHGNDWVILD
jgi:hypothetical protein